MGEWVAGCTSQPGSSMPPKARPKVWCAIIGKELVFSIQINKTQTVYDLKKRIKEKVPSTLASIDAASLKLYKVNIDIDDGDDGDEVKFDRAIRAISQNPTYTKEIQDLSTEPKQVLTNPFRELSAIFQSSPPVDGWIHILVELPQGESIDSMDPRVWCVAETSLISSAMPTMPTMPTADESELIDPKASGAVCGHSLTETLDR